MNGVTWPKLQYYGKSRSLDSSLLLLNKRNIFLNNTNNINQDLKKTSLTAADNKLIINNSNNNNNPHLRYNSSSGGTVTSHSENVSGVPVGLSSAKNTHIQYLRSEHNPVRQCTYSNIKLLPKSKLRSQSPLCDRRFNNAQNTNNSLGSSSHVPNPSTSSTPHSPLLKRMTPGFLGHKRFNSQSSFSYESEKKQNFGHQRQHSLGNAPALDSKRQNTDIANGPEFRNLGSASNNSSLQDLSTSNLTESPRFRPNCSRCVNSNCTNNNTCTSSDDCNHASCSSSPNASMATNSTCSSNCCNNDTQHHHHHHYYSHQLQHNHHHHHSSLRVETLERQQARGLKVN